MAYKKSYKKVDRKQQLENHQAELVEFVISQLNSGKSWSKCWESVANEGLPVSNTTGDVYKGGNLLYLMFKAMSKGYTSNLWGTFNSWKKSGGWVRKGEKSTPIIFFKPIFKLDEKTGEQELVSFYIKGHNVYNRDQIDGLPAEEPTEKGNVSEAPKIVCEGGELYDYCTNQGITVKNAPRACYSPSQDSITLPEAYTDQARGWSTVAHEIVHSTGHKSRLAREGVTNLSFFGSHSYSYEELVAELGSLFLCGELGLSTDDSKEQSAAYLKSWAKKLQDKPEWLWKAAGEASRAVAFIKEAYKAEAKKTKAA